MRLKISLLSLMLIFTLIGCSNNSDSVGYDPEATFVQDLEAGLEEIPVGEKSDSLTAFLQFIREEEKLARDVYINSYDLWKMPVFDRISHSEQRHMDALERLLVRYEIEDPVGENGIGEFTEPLLQDLYNELTTKSSDSLIAALLVGAEIEEIDILDILEALENFDNEDVQFVLTRLLQGSYHHLNAYVRVLARSGIDYQPLYLTADQYEEIIANGDSRRSKGRGKRHGKRWH